VEAGAGAGGAAVQEEVTLWPPRAGAEHVKRREQHRQIPEHIVARTNPRGTHIRVAHSVAPQDAERYGIGCEGGEADAHHDRARQRTLYCVPDDRRNHPKPNTPMLTPLAKAAITW
jgi:hypothetical protein